MDFTRLRSLRELSVRGTMAAVAEALCLTPSAVSQQIAQLEDEAGAPLVERRGRGVRLTPAGALLARHADRVLAVLGEARAGLAELRREVAGELRIAAFASAAALLLPQALVALRRAHPRLELVISELEPAEGLAALGAWQADLALVDDWSAADGAGHPSLEFSALVDDRLCALLPAGHGLASRAAVSLSELEAESWALDSSSSAYAEFVLAQCRRAGFEPRVNARCRGFEMVAALVGAGCSVAVIPGLRRRQTPPATALVPLAPELPRRISIAWRRSEGRHPALLAVLAQVQASARTLGPEGGSTGRPRRAGPRT
ncbi:MAG: LysR family transcriptional regulator [Burkholderiales bacterium]|nr:LysR family transcriptional regulator [Burkholderiales bacterium]